MAQCLPHPPSVAVLQKVGPEVHVLPRGAVVWRVYFRAGPYPSSWNAFRSYARRVLASITTTSPLRFTP